LCAEVLSVLHKIINLTSRQAGADITKLARWLRCLFNLALVYDESVSLKCIDQAVTLASKLQGVSAFLFVLKAIVKPPQDHQAAKTPMLHTPPLSSEPIQLEDDDDSADGEIKEAHPYPPTELEWLATTTFNHGVDYFLQENDKKCREWAEQSFIIASWLEDGGALRVILMERFASLQLQD
tara:strand:+ start:23391 stop:23933 length:543 start_codon:yes stop_codon:yes gene_type:complete